MAHHKLSPLGGPFITKAILFFAPFIILCGILIIKRLVFGIGAVSDLNGGYPWGLWISFDLLVGSGIACGGWALAWAVYVFNKGEYHPLVRPALLASFFGYSLAGLSIMIDIGRYWNVYYLFWPGQFNTSSVLFETAFCMTIYIFVMGLEFSPAIFERFGWKKALKRMNTIMFFLIAFGALLPTMHQSSMGSLMIVAGHKIHPIWQGYEMLPVLSLLTAFIMGFSVAIFEGSLVQSALKGKGPDEKPLFIKITRTIEVMIVLYLIVRFGELIYRDKLGYIFQADFYAILFWIETALIITPLVIFRSATASKSSSMLFIGALCMLIGAGLWRMNYSLFAMNPGSGYDYFPTTSEIFISVGFVAIEIVAYILIIRFLPVLPALTSTNENYEAKKA